MNSEDLIGLLRELTAEVVEFLRKRDFGVRAKGGGEMVTTADLEAERFLRENLPRYPVVGEEWGGTPSGTYWAVDPLDGTHNFIKGLFPVCVSVALVEGGVPLLGAVREVHTGEFYWAVRGEGAWVERGGRRERTGVSEERSLSRAVVATGFPYDKGRTEDNNLKEFSTVLPKVMGVRRFGSAAYDLCCVADGRFDLYWEKKLKVWDVAAGVLLVEESGGEVLALSGKNLYPLPLKGISLVCGNPSLVSSFLSLLGDSRK